MKIAIDVEKENALEIAQSVEKIDGVKGIRMYYRNKK